MAAPKKSWIVVVVLLVVLWLLLRKDHSSAGELAADLATGKVPPVPTFGTDNIVDVADATAALHLTPPPLVLPPPKPQEFPPNYIGKIS